MMTTLKKELEHTILRVERVPKDSPDSSNGDGGGGRHVAGGQHQGIIINKTLGSEYTSSLFGRPFDLRLAFKVYLINAITQSHQQESRELRFWFADEEEEEGESVQSYGYSDRMHCAQAFFRALVHGGGGTGSTEGGSFPKSYVAFIMKLMKTMQSADFRPLLQLELEVRSVDEPFERPPSSAVSSRPCKYFRAGRSSLPENGFCSRVAEDNDQTDPKDYDDSKRKKGPPVPPKPKNLGHLRTILSTSKSLGLPLDVLLFLLIPFGNFSCLEAQNPKTHPSLLLFGF